MFFPSDDEIYQQIKDYKPGIICSLLIKLYFPNAEQLKNQSQGIKLKHLLPRIVLLSTLAGGFTLLCKFLGLRYLEVAFFILFALSLCPYIVYVVLLKDLKEQECQR